MKSAYNMDLCNRRTELKDLSSLASTSSIVNSKAPSSPFERLNAQNLHLLTHIFVGLMWRLMIKYAFSPFFASATPGGQPSYSEQVVASE